MKDRHSLHMKDRHSHTRRPTLANPLEAMQTAVEASQDAHGRWSLGAFHSLCGPGHIMQAASLRRPPFGKWLRAFMSDMVMTSQMPLTKVVRSARIIDILFAKALCNFGTLLTAPEFDAFTRVISDPAPDADLEAQIVWSLFDHRCSGEIGEEDSLKLRALWAKLGREGGEDASFTTLDEYHIWYYSCLPEMRSIMCPSLPPRSLTAPSTSSDAERLESLSRNLGPQRMRFTTQMRPQDHVLRSVEAAEFSLQEGFSSSSGQTFGIRCMTPSRTSKPKRPQGRPVIAMEEGAQAAKKSALPPMANKPLDWEAQNEWWNRKDNRFKPFMEVTASYLRPDGTKVEGTGVLLNGWGIPNKGAGIPHSKGREGARLRDSCKDHSISDSSHQPSARAAQDSALATFSSEKWTEEVRKWKDTENNIVVLVHGFERLVPRDWVKPLHTQSAR